MPREGLDLTGVEAFTEAISERFPKKKTRNFYTGGMELKGEGPPEYLELEMKAVGFLCTSDPPDRVVQGRIDDHIGRAVETSTPQLGR